eukprot:TRINITY_DN1103_c1_g1_i1.p2 TRINITY_DN1103_c1_g1~~TRINITY_DN1103_c1_g1_i1.p2  ORF type:complete len:270 (+),score=112.44 TRINITY_DN1103_c1_g1_i1:85-810(+)
MAMLKTGVVSDQSNDHAAAALDDMIEYMKTDEYRQKRERENAPPPEKPDAVYMRTAADVAESAVPMEDRERVDAVETTVAEDDDAEVADLRAQRLARLKARREKEQTFKARGHGMYRDVSEKDFLPEVTSTGCVAVHFFHEDFARCKVMDEKLGLVTPRQVQVKFLRINAQEAPFFVEKLSVQVLPCVVFFKDGVAVDRILGFEGLTYSDTFTTSALERYVCRVFKLEPSAECRDEETMEE